MKRVIIVAVALMALPLLVRLLVAQSPPPSQTPPPPPPTYRLTDLGRMDLSAAPSGPTGINSNGQVAGLYFNYTTQLARAFLWNNGTLTELGTLGGASSFGYGINTAVQIVGTAHLSNAGFNTVRAFIWQNAVMTNLGDPTGNASLYSEAFAIDSAGDVGGYEWETDGYQHPIIWKGGTHAGTTILPGLPCNYPVCQGQVLALNDTGQAAGWSVFGTGGHHPVIWDANGQATDLGSLGAAGYNSHANAINSNGLAVGYSTIDAYTVHAFSWQNGVMTDLGAIPGANPYFTNLPPDNNSSAWGVNSKGYVVGISAYGTQPVTQGNGGRAFLYIPNPAPATGGTMYDLLSLVAPGTNWKLLHAAWAINDNGQIVGVGIDPTNSDHGFLLTPIITPTTTTLTSSVNPSVFAQQVSFTAMVAPTQSSALTPTGNVTFNDGSTVLGTVSLSSGSATFSTAALGVGSHAITVSYAGDNNFGSSTSTVLNQTVNQAGTATTLSASPNPASFGQPVSFIATVGVVAPGSGTPTGPTGTVTFLDGTTSLGTGTLNSAGTATFTASLLTPGSHNVTASYGGDANFTGSASGATNLSVTLAPPAITSPASGFSTTNSSLTVIGTGAPGATVAILDGATTVGTSTINSGGSFTATITLAVGPHSLTATQSLNAVTGAASATVNITIAPAAPAITSPASGFTTTNPSVVVTGTGTPGATVAVLDGTTSMGTGTINSAGSFAVTITLPVGTHSLTATQTLNGIASAASAAVTVSILLPPVQITDNETIHVTDTSSFPDVFDPEAVHVTDAVFVTPLINVAAPVADFSAGSLGFGNIAAGQTGTQSLTMSDIGKAPLVVSSAVTSPGSAFAISQIACSNGATSLPTTLPVGGACTLLISYAAPSAAAVNDVLTFTDNAALSNVASTPVGSSYTQSISLNGSGSATPPPPPPPAVILLSVNETVHVTDTASLPDVFDPETITVSDQVTVKIISSPTTTSITAPAVTYGTAAIAMVSVSSLGGTVAGNVTLSVDGGAASSLGLTGGSAIFKLGVLKAGNHSLAASFAAQGAFNASSATSTITISQATPTITWANPAPITYGTALSGTQLNATASVPGSFTYNPPAGTVLNAGSQTLTVSFNPTDSVDYTPATATITLQVNQATPTITWANPAAITYGTALSGTQLKATASVPGTFTYKPAAGTVLNAGSQTLLVAFTPTDTTNYAAATAIATLQVNQATPVIKWPGLAPITYGKALGGAQLNATSSVPGTFVYNPPAGTVLTAGSQTLVVAFTPTDTTNYTAAKATVTLQVNQATPTIIWANPAGITYGTALSGTLLNATASVPGTFVYTPANGTVLGAGSQTLSVVFVPSDSTDYTKTTATVTLQVNQATPAIKWPNPAAITYGTALSGAQLNAAASVQGTFTYSPAAGTVLSAGSQTLSVKFNPTDSVDYTPVAASVTLQVNQATPIIKWPNPTPITYGTPLGSAQLNAIASVPGTFSYSPPAGTVLSAGSQTLSVKFNPTDSVDYTPVAASVTLQVNQATPIITWANPVPITYGTALSATQLNATASVPGTFVYTPPAGTVLSAGSQTLSVVFVPTDSTDYTKATASVTLQVVCGVLIKLSSATVPLGGTITVTANVISCSTTTQTLVVSFMLSGPEQPNSCSSTKSVMFTTPPFPLPPKTSQTVSFLFKVPSSGVCPGRYSITATTLVNGVAVDTSTASLTITAH